MGAASDILVEIYISDEIAQLKHKLEPKHLADDIIQHCFTELFAKPDDFIIDLNNRRKLKAYIVSMIINTCSYSRTPFSRQIGENEYPTPYLDESVPDEDDENVLQNFTKVFNSLYWYKKEILRLYAEMGTYKAVSDDTGIPVTSIFNTIKEAKKEIKKKLWK